MKYDFYIFRQPPGEEFDSNSEISEKEWLAYISSDKELEPNPALNTDYALPKDWHYEWKDHPVYKEAGERPWFRYNEGHILSDIHDADVVIKMIAIAEALGAIVLDKNGKPFDRNQAELLRQQIGEPLVSSPTSPAKPKGPWWKFW